MSDGTNGNGNGTRGTKLGRAAETDLAIFLARIGTPAMLGLLLLLAGWTFTKIENAWIALDRRVVGVETDVGAVRQQIIEINGKLALATYIDQQSAQERKDIVAQLRSLSEKVDRLRERLERGAKP